jgi:hypothetical protein
MRRDFRPLATSDQAQDGVRRTTKLERAAALQVLALEEDGAAGTLVEGFRTRHRSAQHERRDAVGRRSDICEPECGRRIRLRPVQTGSLPANAGASKCAR